MRSMAHRRLPIWPLRFQLQVRFRQMNPLTGGNLEEFEKAIVLCVGRDRVLLETRLQMLRQSYESLWAEDCDGLRRLEASAIDLIILCHSFTAVQRGEIIACARERWPQTHILEILNADSENVSAPADATVKVWEGPYALMRSVDHLLSQSDHSAGGPGKVIRLRGTQR
jgi:hypothetical protein